MGLELETLVRPGQVALVTQECQQGVLGEPAIFPELAAVARQGMLDNVVRLAGAARAAGVPVVHCVAGRRADGAGSNTNARLFAAAARAGVQLLPGTPATEVCPELGPAEGDLVLNRLHGIGPMWGTDLDPVLRNLGVRTIVGVGVSVNVGMTNLVMDAVNAGYRFVLPRDAVAGVPPAYAEAVIEHTLSLLATVVTSAEILDLWRAFSG